MQIFIMQYVGVIGLSFKYAACDHMSKIFKILLIINTAKDNAAQNTSFALVSLKLNSDFIYSLMI